MARIARVYLALLVTAASLWALAAPAQAGFELVPGGFKVEAGREGGSPEAQAGAHPFQLQADFEIAPDETEFVSGAIHDVYTKLPPGLIGNPEATPKCSLQAFNEAIIDEHAVGCPNASQIGIAYVSHLKFGLPGSRGVYPVFMLPAPDGVPASFGFPVDRVPVVVNADVDTAGNYGVETVSLRTSQGLPVNKVELTLWGSPQAHAHDAERFCGRQTYGQLPDPTEPCAVDAPRTPFLTNPTLCTEPQTSILRIDSWQEQGLFKTAESTGPDIVGCDLLRFSPTFSAASTSRGREAPTGLNAEIDLPQGDDPETGLAPAALKDAVVTLPRGMTINPASADGLGACADDQLGLHSNGPVTCPDSARLGTVVADTPLLDHPLRGTIFLRTQASQDPSSGEMFRLAMVFDDPQRGLLIKLPGQLKVDADSGQLTTTFPDNPPLPVSHISLSLRSGPRAPLVTPSECGTFTIETALAPWSGNAAATPSSSFKVDQGCSRPRFSPGFAAGVANPIAGSSSVFTLRLTREDGEENLSALSVTLPKGLSAKLAGVPVCSETGATSGACPDASRVGSATVGAGPGPSPVYVPQPGKPGTAVYLAGPYKGAPYSLVVKVPAQAGPFDLGDVTVRNALYIDPESAQVTAKSDPLPQIVKGVPIAYRDLRIAIDRSDFVRNPTSCDAASVDGSIAASGGAQARVSDRFQVAGCERLGFKPSLKLSVKGPTHRGGHPAFKAVLEMPKGGANVQKAQVTLPKAEMLEQAHIRTVCTRVQYAAGAGGGTQCPPASIYGKAKAWSPLLDEPLTGPVYLRSSSHQLPDLVASLDGQIHIDLVGRIDAVNARIRNTFEGVPDAPVSRFVLEMQGGKKGLLANNTELCKTTPKASVAFDGQNGKLADSSPVMRADCGKGRKKK